MPLVLAENEATESGITYADRTGISYQYPRSYRRTIRAGERFVYYRGRKRRSGGRAPQVYFGTGVIGAIAEDAREPSRLTCQVLDYQPFSRLVPFKRADGTYFEASANRRGYFQRGVRRISEDEFHEVLLAAEADSLQNAASNESLPSSGDESVESLSYASLSTNRAVEDFAVRVAVLELERRHGHSSVEPQPRNNPGFDLRVRTPHGTFFIEVKGTSRRSPQFFVTEGELQFSRAHADHYQLVVVYGIDLEAQTSSIRWFHGPVSAENGFRLTPVQWACVETPPDPT